MSRVVVEIALDTEALLEEARRRSGLDDFGPTWFLEGMKMFLSAARTEARYTPEGRRQRTESVLGGLINRLQMFDYIKRYPGILDEELKVAGVVVGLPRTGSTMMHRLLDSGPNMTAVRIWECAWLAPLPGEERGNPVERRARGQKMVDELLAYNPDLAALHPLVPDAAEEEVDLLGQWFTSLAPESLQWVPSFGEWHRRQDQHAAYADLVTALKFLQWQQPSRRFCYWVLKTPSHLADLPALLDTFPEAKIINTHRDPLETIPSYASYMMKLYSLTSDPPDPKIVGPYWSRRWGALLEEFLAARQQFGSERFIDVQFRDVIKDKMAQVKRVFESMGLPLSEAGVAKIEHAIENDPHRIAGKHHYTMDEYGLTRELIESDFAAYREEFILPHAGQALNPRGAG